MQKYVKTYVDGKGNLESGVLITVYQDGSTLKATLYADDEVTVLSNPITVAADGTFSFKVANGQYKLSCSDTASPLHNKIITLVDSARPDQSNVASPIGVVRVLGRSGTAVSAPADTSEDILGTVTIPANWMGKNGMLKILSLWSCTNNANVKTARIRLGGIGGTAYETVALANNAAAQSYEVIWNANSTNSQVGSGAVGFGATATANITSAIDTTVDQTIVFTGQKATAGDTLTLAGYVVELFSDGS